VFYKIIRRFKRRMILVLMRGMGIGLLIGWEVIRVISFLLIGYLQRRRKSSRGRVNALISNRIGDAIILVFLYGRTYKCGRERE